MTRLQKMTESDYTPLIRVLFGLSSPSPVTLDPHESQLKDLKFIDQSLNDSQKEAIKFALQSRDVALIHGPPGVRIAVLRPGTVLIQ